MASYLQTFPQAITYAPSADIGEGLDSFTLLGHEQGLKKMSTTYQASQS